MLCLLAQSCLTLCDPMDCSPSGSSFHGDSPGKNTGLGCHPLLQRIFTTQGLNPGLQYYRWILYHLSHQGNPRILEWVAYPFSRGSSQPRNQTRVCTHKNSLSYNRICVLHTSHNSIQKEGCENGYWMLNIGPESIPDGTLSPRSLSFTWLPGLPQPSLQE